MQNAVKWLHRRQALPVFLLLACVAMLAACQPVQPPSATGGGSTEATTEATVEATTEASVGAIPEVQIAVDDTAFTIPADFPGGIVQVTVQNNSSKDLDVGFVRVREGSSVDDIQLLAADFEANMIPLLSMVSFMASFNPVPAGAAQTAIMDFRTGEFLVDATEHSEGLTPPGQPHIFGIFKAEELIGTTEPQADVKVEMHDFAFTLPDEITSGPLLWEYQNLGEQWHMQFFVKPGAGVTTDAALAALLAEEPPAGPPPFEIVPGAGIAPIGEGERVWLEFALAPGVYMVGCPIPDLAAIMSGAAPVSHLAHGMHRVLTVK